MTLIELLALAAAGCTAGAINAVAGGGTLVTFPVLLMCGTPPVMANVTSTVGLVIGTAGSIVSFRKHLRAIRHWLVWFIPVGVIGAAIGSWLLTKTTDDQFSKLIPFLVLFATVLFFLQGFLRKSATETKSKALWFSIALQLPVAIYGAFFGAGIGILMLASFGFMGMTHIHEMNALKNLLGSLINVVAALWFISAGMVNWPQALTLTAGALVGYYFGAHYSQRIEPRRVRHLITAIGFIISIVMFWKQFG
ncbi:sulfite exporter TauE/SafE family protein [Prosthecobacter sp.]|uniref:sulfite exporter TauE/SafE family protein n=1 Tax=Prosthecobacter sp. TaxID=1965333 RepID=UPI001D20848A|nr:sulfite exporter TauE/SafE family protein [Prosthecobacter sp.]MCB1275041.1 sulfite exporter TauE/SafE family protein [Prosthecobacter sp.]